MPNDAGSLAGIRVLDLTRLLPGAYATLLLAELGADVIKIEDPRGGDSMRELGARAFFDRLNRGKRSVTLNLRSPDALAVLDGLAASSDVIVDSFRPSTARRLGVHAEALHARYPRAICVSINGFGLHDPNADRAAHDINYQALAGLLAARGSTSSPRAGGSTHSTSSGQAGSPRAGGSTDSTALEQASSPRAGPEAAETLTLSLSKGEPRMPGPLVGDIGAAMQAAFRIVAALFERSRTGVGCVVDVAIYDAARAWSRFPSTDDLASACYNLYETADGQWLALGALEPKFWAGFCERLGRADLAPLQHARGDTGAQVLAEVRTIMKSRTRDQWMALFANDDVCLTTVDMPDLPTADCRLFEKSAPAIGADTDQLLEEAGIDVSRRAALRAAGVI